MKRTLKVLLICTLLGILVTTNFAQFPVSQMRNEKFVPTAKDFAKPVSLPNFSVTVKKGILECAQNFNLCMVMNMPLLSQSDPRIDADLQDMSPWGCYDTAIVTVINTALANRNSSLVFNGRTKVFDNFVGDAIQPKEIKQLSYQYRNAKRHAAKEMINGIIVQPLYFHEVAANFNNGKIMEKCNPFIYQDCAKLGNTAQATTLFTDARRMWMANAADISNETIIELMESGYVVMLAYMRYKPDLNLRFQGVKTPPDPRLPVNMSFESFHKVVVSGFRKGAKYPLIVNDVGNAQRYNVSIGTDLSKRKFQSGKHTTFFLNAKFSFLDQPNPKTKTFVEYEGEGQGINDKVFFLQHYDYLKINQ